MEVTLSLLYPDILFTITPHEDTKQQTTYSPSRGDTLLIPELSEIPQHFPRVDVALLAVNGLQIRFTDTDRGGNISIRSTEEVVLMLRGPRLLRHKSSMTSPRGWEQQINRVPSAGRSSGSGW